MKAPHLVSLTRNGVPLPTVRTKQALWEPRLRDRDIFSDVVPRARLIHCSTSYDRPRLVLCKIYSKDKRRLP